MSRRAVTALFVLGWAVGIPMAALYIIFSPSHDRVFHGFVMLAACGVSFPAVSIFLNITLKMWDKQVEMSDKQVEFGKVFADLRDQITPLVKDAKGVIKSVEDMVNRFGDQPKAVVDFIDKIAKDGTVEKLTTSFDSIMKKIHEVIDLKPATGKSREELLKEMEDGKSHAADQTDLR